jgi:hypothetical protein
LNEERDIGDEAPASLRSDERDKGVVSNIFLPRDRCDECNRLQEEAPKLLVKVTAP